MEIDEYLTISGKSEATFRVLGSKFIGIAIPVESEQEAKEIIEEYRKQFYNATHCCYAYKIGEGEETYRFNDDGEPSGTAGKPIYGQIRSSNLEDIIILVVRYFGGTKLGTGGLIKAYKAAAQAAIEEAKVLKKVRMAEFELKFDYLQMNEVMKTLKNFEINVLKNNSGMKCVMDVAIRKGIIDEVKAKLSELRGLEIREL